MDEKESIGFDVNSLSDEELFDGFNDDLPDAADDEDADEAPEESKDDAAEDTDEEADQPDAESTDETDEEEKSSDAKDEQTEEKDEAKATDQKFRLKHLDEVREVDRDEVVELAQKGMDYDRIRSERDTLKANKAKLDEYEDFLKKIAGDQSIEDLIDSTVAKLQAKEAEAKGETLDEVEAFKKLRMDRVKREAKNPPPAQEEQKTEEEANKEKFGKSIQRFLKEYPNIKAEEVPAEVWKDYHDGRADLLECYQLYENKKLKDEIKSLKQNQKNKERSTGSKKSTGKKQVDQWFDGWPDD